MNLRPVLATGGGGGGDVRLNALPGGGGGGAIRPATDVAAVTPCCCCCHGGKLLEGGGGGTGATGEGGHCSWGSVCCVTGATGGCGITNSTTDNSHLYTITRFAADLSNACTSVNYYATKNVA